MRYNTLRRIGVISSGSKSRSASVIPIGVSPDADKIALMSGTGYAGSTYTANFPTGGQWFADGVAISGATGLNYTMTVANEGKSLTYRRSGVISNSIQLWMYPMLGTALKCWYDAALTTSFTYQGGVNVRNWANRVSGAVAATQNTTNKYPQFTTNGLQSGYNAVVANGTFQQFTMASGFALGDQTVLAVMKTSDTKTTTTTSWWGSPGIWGNEVSGFPADFAWGFQAGYPMFGASNTKFTSTTKIVADGQPMLLSYTRNNTTGLINNYHNGSFLDSGTTAAGTRTINNGTTSLFNSNSMNNVASGNATYLSAAISDFIIVDTVLLETDRAQLEGCAAWRWGLQSVLDPEHPFKNGPPGFLLEAA
ncbi:hypothetical protein D3C72_259160 [compost metagenome]